MFVHGILRTIYPKEKNDGLLECLIPFIAQICMIVLQLFVLNSFVTFFD